MALNLVFSIYSLSLFFFSLTVHPIFYCGLLVFNSLISGFICYLVFGFSWYSLLFCLVYIGGVYILFIFVSVFSPNTMLCSSANSHLLYGLVILLVCTVFMITLLISYSVVPYEFSKTLCTLNEGSIYLFMCMTLLFSFIVLSIIMSVKFNHYR